VTQRPFVIIESPFRSKTEPQADAEYLVYLRRALRDSWDRGEHPFASHAFYPFFLREGDPDERKAGIECGYLWWKFATRIIFYTDYNMSPGMEKALDRAVHHRMDTMVRMIGRNGEAAKDMQSAPAHTTPFMGKPPRDLTKLIEEAVARFNSLPPEEQAAHREAQRKSWVIGELMLSNPTLSREEAAARVEAALRNG
jgi:hypothetical protein